MAATLRGTATKLRLELQEWAWSTGLLTVAAGWAIGSATKQLIEGILEAVVLPLWAALLATLPATRALARWGPTRSLGMVLRHILLLQKIRIIRIVSFTTFSGVSDSPDWGSPGTLKKKGGVGGGHFR